MREHALTDVTNVGGTLAQIGIVHLLEHQAKAMVVTDSRKAAVRYKLALDKYVSQQGYTDVHALVAFSGDVEDKDSGPEAFNERSRASIPSTSLG